MEISEVITPFLCVISPFALGWIIFCLLFVIRGDWEAGGRLFLLGMGLVGALLAIGLIVYFLPDWAAVALMLIGAFLPWIAMLRYFAGSKFSGRLLMALPSGNEKWSISILSGAFPVILGLSQILSHNDFFASEKSFALSISLISLGVFRAVKRIRSTQIREKGILYEFGNFYSWENIENYRWKFSEDKLSLKLRKAFFKRNVDLKISSQFKQQIIAHLSQNVKIEENKPEGYVSTQKAG